MGSLELENGKTVGFLCKDGSVKVLPDTESLRLAWEGKIKYKSNTLHAAAFKNVVTLDM